MKPAGSVFVCGALLGAMAVAGQTAADDPWRASALYGGDVRSLAFDPSEPDRVLAGTSSGQIYMSSDGGTIWRHAGAQAPFGGWVVSDLEFDGEQPGRVWAALWRVWGGGGRVAVSDDLGQSWTERSSGLPEGQQVYALEQSGGRLYAAVRGGVWGSDDQGENWRLLSAELGDVGKVTSLLVDPWLPDTVYAGTWRRAYRSDDRGRSWWPIFQGMLLDSEVFTLRSAAPGELWASTCGWVYRSADRGGLWRRYQSGMQERRTPSLEVLADGRLLAGTVAGLYSSDNNGGSFTRRTPRELAIHAIAFHPRRPRRVLIGTEGSGVWLSEDGADSFRPSSWGMTGLRIAALTTQSAELVAAVRYGGPFSGVHLSSDSGVTFQRGPEQLPTVLSLASDGERVWAATEQGLWERHADRWRRLEELSKGRVPEVVAREGRVVARAGGGLWHRQGGRFERLDFHHGTPRSIALLGGDLWVTDQEGLYRLSSVGNDPVATPFAGGRVRTLGETLVYGGSGGLWLRDPQAASWGKIDGRHVRVLETGDERLPLLILPRVGEAAFWDAAGKRLLPLVSPVPAPDVTAALIVRDRLYLATSGYGLLFRDLPLEEPAAAGGGSVTTASSQ